MIACQPDWQSGMLCSPKLVRRPSAPIPWLSSSRRGRIDSIDTQSELSSTNFSLEDILQAACQFDPAKELCIQSARGVEDEETGQPMVALIQRPTTRLTASFPKWTGLVASGLKTLTSGTGEVSVYANACTEPNGLRRKFWAVRSGSLYNQKLGKRIPICH